MENKKEIAKVQLGFFPTPFYRLNHISEDLGVNLYIKRDDFSGMSLFGGNKIRKLEYLLGDAVRKGCDTVFTYGATQSNHAMQTVTACRRLGLTPILYLVALVRPDENDIRSNLLLDKILGAEIHIVEQQEGETEEEAEERSFVMAREHAAKLEAEGHKCYDVPMGGANPIGSAAFVEGYLELQKQLQAMNVQMDYLFHATGTGGTMAGLVAGRAAYEETFSEAHHAEIISINVSHKDQKAYHQKCTDMGNQALELMGYGARIRPEDFHTELGYYAPGYEMPNEGATAAIKYLAEKEGLLVDPVYTGKAFAGMLDFIRTEKVPKGSHVVFWHTGGATALFAEKEILGEI